LDGMPWEVKLHKKSNPHSNGFLWQPLILVHKIDIENS
jgi:hypothetical protein